jgi:hypothetical protein
MYNCLLVLYIVSPCGRKGIRHVQLIAFCCFFLSFALPYLVGTDLSRQSCH